MGTRWKQEAQGPRRGGVTEWVSFDEAEGAELRRGTRSLPSSLGKQASLEKMSGRPGLAKTRQDSESRHFRAQQALTL